jgi:hypothetical protein
MNLAEFYAEIAPTLPDVGTLRSRASTKNQRLLRSMNHLKLFVVGTLASLALGQDALANPAARIQVSDIKTLLIRAIDQGSAQGVLVGEAATYVRQKFESTAPIEIDVRTLYALPQARLQPTRSDDTAEGRAGEGEAR